MNKYIIFILAIVLCFTIGCQNREKITELGKLKAEFEIEQENKALAIRYIESISKGDFDVLNELLAPDYAIYSPSGYPSPSSREKLIENYIAARDSFSKFDWSLEDIMAQKDKVICRIIIRGVFNGEIPNLPSNEQEFMFSLITIMRIENGKVVEEWQEDDQLGFARQLGMELRPITSDE